MRRFDTIAALIATTLLATAAHAGDRPDACDINWRSSLAGSNKSFGDNDFGGSYNASAGLVVPGDFILLMLCTNWDGDEAIIQGMIAHGDPQRHIDAVREHQERLEDQIQDVLDAGLRGSDLGAEVGADLTLFGKTKDVFRLDAGVSEAGGGATIEVLGLTLFDTSFTTRVGLMYGTTFFTARQGVDLGIIELSAKAELVGMLGVNGEISSVNNGFQGTVTPMTALDVEASAIFDVAIASAGVIGSLNLLDISLPITATVTTSGWNLTVNALIEALEGSIEIFAEAFGEEASEVLADWDGITLLDKRLFRGNGSF